MVTVFLTPVAKKESKSPQAGKKEANPRRRRKRSKSLQAAEKKQTPVTGRKRK